MNSPERRLRRERAAEDARCRGRDGEREATERARLRSLKVKTVIRENHGAACTRVIELAPSESACGNLFATVGGKTLTVYDDEHFGEHAAVVAQYAHETTEHQEGGEITAMCWVRWSVDKENANVRRRAHEFGDAVLAIGDEHGFVSVISVAENRVVARIKAHASAVRDMDGARGRDGFIVSIGDDGMLKAWDVFGGEEEGECAGTFQVGDACSVACHADGALAVTGHRSGANVKRWNLAGGITQTGEKLSGGFGATFTPRHAVECVRIVGDVVFAKTRDARFETYDLAKNKPIAQWSEPNERARSGANLKRDTPPSRFGVSPNGKYLATGDSTSSAELFIHDARTGELISTLQPLRVTGAVHAAAVVDHCRHAFASYGPGVVWRYEVVPEPADDASISPFEAASA